MIVDITLKSVRGVINGNKIEAIENLTQVIRLGNDWNWNFYLSMKALAGVVKTTIPVQFWGEISAIFQDLTGSIVDNPDLFAETDFDRDEVLRTRFLVSYFNDDLDMCEALAYAVKDLEAADRILIATLFQAADAAITKEAR